MDTATADTMSEAARELNAWFEDDRKLPVPPTVFLKLMKLGKDPRASAKDYANIIATSTSLASKLLAVVNSSWFGVRSQVKNIKQAVNLLGTVNARVLSITHCLAAAHDGVRLPSETLTDYWKARLIKAQAAQYMANQLDRDVADEAFLVGLMQDMVLPMMHAFDAGPYEQAGTRAAPAPAEWCAAERKVFGMDHGQAAARLGRAIGIPEVLCDLLAHHHEPSALDGVPPGLADAVYFSSLFPHTLTRWDGSEAAQAAELIEQKLASPVLSVEAAVREIQMRFVQLAEYIRPSSSDDVDLPGLLREATGEIAESTVTMVGQLHSLMSNAVQADSQLAAVNVEALRLQEQTQEDPLTGVLNRFGLEQIGVQRIRHLRETGKSLTVVFADVNDFKMINDRFGHDKGDVALQHVATMLRQTFGPAAIVSRYGGDEFVVLSGGLADCSQAKALAMQFLDSVRQEWRPDEESGIEIGLSIGGIWCTKAPPEADFSKLLAAADGLMYEAKLADGIPVVFKQLT